jgi:PAS domain S-box-containing protein
MARIDTSNKNNFNNGANTTAHSSAIQELEEVLKKNAPKLSSGLSEALKIINRLKRQQQALEAQNSALIQAKCSAQENAEKFTRLYEAAPAGHFTLSKDGKVVELNICGSQMLNKERSYLINSQFVFFVSNDSKPVFLNFLKKIYESKTRQTCELVVPGGGNMPIDVHITGIADEKSRQCFLTAVDITDHKLTDIVNEHRYQILTEVAPVGIFHTDPTGYTTYVNPSWCRITGLSDEEALGNNWLKAVHEEDKKTLYKDWQKAVKTHEISISEYRFIRSDGSVAWVMGQAIPEKNLDDEVLGYIGTITDITERKKVEQKQREVQDFLKETQTIANLGTYTLDLIDETWSSSEILDEIFGIEANYDKTIENLIAIMHPDWQAMLGDYFNEVIATKTKFDKEYKITRINDKTERWVHGIGRLKLNEQGKPIMMLGTIHDITHRKLMEIELIKAKERAEESTSKFRNYVENAPDGVFVCNERGEYVEVNPAATLVTGYTGDELLRMSIKDITPPGSLEFAFNHLQALLENGISKDEMTFIHKDGSIRWWSVDSVKLSESRFLGFVKDITERKQTEADIKKSNERFELLAKATNDGLWDWSIESNYVWANEMHQQLYGLSFDDPVPDFECWKNRIHPDDRENSLRVFEEAMASQKPIYSEEYRFYTENTGWINVYGRTLIERNKEGKPTRLIGSMLNITERKSAEMELLKSKQQFQNLVENISGVYWVNNLDTYQTLYISPSYETIWGRKCDDLMNNSADFINSIHPDDQPALFEAHKNVANTKVNNVSYRIVRPGGEIRWILAKTNVVIDAMGTKIEYGYAEDITERKKTEEAIIASEEKYRTLVEQASDAIFIADANGKFITVNSSMYKMSKYTPEELSKLTVYDFIDTDDFRKNPLRLNELMKEKSIISERVIKIKNNVLLNIEINAKLLTGRRLLVFIRDISESKKAQRALAESENRLRTIVQTEPECIKLLNINGEMEDINPAGLEMLEADSMEQVIGKSVLDTINVPYKKAYRKIIKNGFNGKPGVIEYEITGYKGSHRWFDTHAVPLTDSEGKITSLLCVTRNITKNKKAQEEINKTAEQLRQLTAHLQSVREEERKRIGREIHDELGQQLTAIKMDVVWIDKKIPEETPVLKSKMKNIIGLLDGSNQSIRRILSELRPVILDDHGLLEAMEWLDTQFTANTGIPVKFACSENEIKSSEQIATCIFRVYQEAFTNITRHACAESVSTALSIVDDTIMVTIKDDGKGFDMEAVQNKKSFGIFGMKERVISLHGKFELISVPGKGTTIIMILPYSN